MVDHNIELNPLHLTENGNQKTKIKGELVRLMKLAAKGETTGLADWLDTEKSFEGIPPELIAELIRTSNGCINNVTVGEVLETTSTKTVRYVEHFFEGRKKKRGRKPMNGIKVHSEIYEDYRSAVDSGKKKNDALLDLEDKYRKSIHTLSDIIKMQSQLRKMYLRLERSGTSEALVRIARKQLGIEEPNE